MQYSLAEIRAIPIFFIVGKGRSGTTLLSTILDSHPKVASAIESRFLLILWQRYKRMKVWKPQMAEEFYKNIMLDLQVKNLWSFKENFIQALQQLPPETSARDLIKMVYLFRQSNFPKEKIEFIVDKNPMYTLFVDQIKTIFPEAKFYRLIRDPRDNVTSHKRIHDLHCGFLALKWKLYNLKLDRFESKYSIDFFTQRFEDLITDKHSFFSKFEAYTKIDSLAELEDKRLHYKEKLEEKFDDKLKNIHQASIRPLDTKKINHYKKILSEKEILTIEQICFPYANAYGYEANSNNFSISLFHRLRWEMRYLFLQISSKLIYNLPFFIMKIISNHYAKKE